MTTKRRRFWAEVAMVLGLKSLNRDIADMPWRPWKRVAYQTRVAMGDKNIGMLGAGIAYYGTLAFFPMMVLLVSMSALFVQPERFQDTVDALNSYLPRDVASLITSQLGSLMNKPAVSISAAVIALIVALWSVSGAADAIVRALNVAYDVQESRSLFKLKRLSIYMTFLLVLVIAIMLPLVVLTESWLAGSGLPLGIIIALATVRWLLLIVAVMVGINLVYKIAPAHAQRWRWVSWGSLVATGLWMTVTTLFFVYVRYFANFSDSYSLFAGMIILMIWLNLSSLSLLLGAIVDRVAQKR